jgi:hypothetical protein
MHRHSRLKTEISTLQLGDLAETFHIAEALPIVTILMLIVMINLWWRLVIVLGNIMPPFFIWIRADLIRSLALPPNVRRKLLANFPEIRDVFDMAREIDWYYNRECTKVRDTPAGSWQNSLAAALFIFNFAKANFLLVVVFIIAGIGAHHHQSLELDAAILCVTLALAVYGVLKAMFAIEQDTHQMIFAVYRTLPEKSEVIIDQVTFEDTAYPISNIWWKFQWIRSFLPTTLRSALWPSHDEKAYSMARLLSAQERRSGKSVLSPPVSEKLPPK